MSAAAERGSYRGPRQEVHWGLGCLDHIADIFEVHEWSRPLIVTGRSVARSPLIRRLNGLLDGRARTSLWDGAREHCPRASIVAGLCAVEERAPNVLIAVGGGSAIDTAAAIIITAEHGREPLPIVAVPTTLSQAEFTDFVGITEEDGTKSVLRDARSVPKVVFLDPCQLHETPDSLLRTAAAKALESTIASLVQGSGGLFGSGMALNASRRMLEALPDLPSRTDAVLLELQLCSWLAVFGRFHGPQSYAEPVPRPWLGSAARHQLGARSGAPHGAISAALLPGLIAFHSSDASNELLDIARSTGGQDSHDLHQSIISIWLDLGLPTSLANIGVTEEQVRSSHLAILEEQPALCARGDDVLAFLLAQVGA